MSMGTSAAYADVIDEKSIKKFCPKEWKALMAEVRDDNDNWALIAEGFGYQEERGTAEINEAYYNLCNAFEKKTGLGLGVAYHGEDDGDCYDEVNGIYWYCDGVYEKTPAGKKMDKHIERKFFVCFG